MEEPRERVAEEAAAAERAGEWEHAAALYRQLFRRAVEEGAAESLHAPLVGGSRAFRNLGTLEDAGELAELSYEIARRTGRPGDEADSLNQMATVLHADQELPAAQQLYREALEKARDLGDDPLVAKTCLNIGVIHHTLGNLREARALYLESVSAGLRSGFAQHAARAYNNLGMVCTDLGEWLEAQMHVERGIEIAERLQDAELLAILRTNRVEPLIHLGELAAAAEEAKAAEALARRVSRHSALSDIARFRAMIAMAEGRLDMADDELRLGLAIAQEHGLELCRAETLEQLGRLRRRQGRMEESLEALEQAFDGFFALGAKRDVSRVAPLLEERREGARERVRIGGSP